MLPRSPLRRRRRLGDLIFKLIPITRMMLVRYDAKSIYERDATELPSSIRPEIELHLNGILCNYMVLVVARP